MRWSGVKKKKNEEEKEERKKNRSLAAAAAKLRDRRIMYVYCVYSNVYGLLNQV